MIELLLILLTVFLIAAQRKLSGRISTLEKELATVRSELHRDGLAPVAAAEQNESGIRRHRLP
jgi:hypothetical protein